jgi:hypothetical protein
MRPVGEHNHERSCMLHGVSALLNLPKAETTIVPLRISKKRRTIRYVYPTDQPLRLSSRSKQAASLCADLARGIRQRFLSRRPLEAVGQL